MGFIEEKGSNLKLKNIYNVRYNFKPYLTSS